jgi:hypothetical protein
MSTPRTKTVCTEVSGDAEWIWRAAAEDVLPAAVRRAPGGRTVRAGWQAQAPSATPYQDMTVSHCSSRDVTFLVSWRGHPGQTGPGRSPVTSHRRASHRSPPHRHQRLPMDRKPPRAPPGRAARRRGSGPHRRCGRCPQPRPVGHRCLLAGTGDQRARSPRLRIGVPEVRSIRWSGAGPGQLR